VPAAATVEQHLPAGTEPRHDVLEIRHGRRGAAEHSGVQRPSPGGEQTQRDEAAADLEAAIRNVLVRHPVSGDMEGRPEQEGERTRAEKRTGSATDRNVERDDHRPDDRLCSRAMSFFDRIRNWLAGPPHVKTGDAEEAADLKQEFGAPDPGREDIERLEHGYAGGGPVPGLAGRDSAEIAESEIESEEAPPDPGT
jgi:hypothetical protein